MLAAVYTSDRSPHAALHGAAPYPKMHGKGADMTGLHAIGARAHVEVHATTMRDKGGGGNLCGFDLSSRFYRVSNTETEVIVESWNVTFF